MFELDHLLLDSWTRENSQCLRRTIRDGAGRKIGFAELAPTSRDAPNWFNPRIIRVFQIENDSLTLKAIETWGRRWEVVDADGRRIGRFQHTQPEDARVVAFRSAVLHDAQGRCFAEMISTFEDGHHIAAIPSGETVAVICRQEESPSLELKYLKPDDPLMRVIVLAMLSFGVL